MATPPSTPRPRRFRGAAAPGWLAAALLTLCTAPGARGQGVVRDSIGATPSGRGGTNIAHSDNLTLILDNPAGLVNLPDRRSFELGADLLMTRLDYADPLNNAHADFMPFVLPSLAAAGRTADDRLACGVGVFAPAGFGATYQLKHFWYGQREHMSLGALVKIPLALSLRLDERLSVGGGLGVGISHAQLELPDHLQTGPWAGLPAMVDLKATGVAPVWSVGAQYKLSEQTTLGLAYVGQTRVRMRGDAQVDVSGLGLPLLKAAYDADVDLTWPASLGLGVSHRFNEQHRLSGDVLWFPWSQAFDKLDLRLDDGSNPLFALALGPRVRDRVTLDWRDSIAVRLGYEFFPTRQDVIRLGYIFHKSPIPADTLLPNLGGTLEHAITAGYGHQWDRWRVDLAYQYSWGPAVHTGNNRFVGGSYDFGTFEAQAHWIIVTFSWRP